MVLFHGEGEHCSGSFYCEPYNVAVLALVMSACVAGEHPKPPPSLRFNIVRTLVIRFNLARSLAGDWAFFLGTCILPSSVDDHGQSGSLGGWAWTSASTVDVAHLHRVVLRKED